MARRGLSVYLPNEVRARVERRALEHNRSESSVIAEVLRTHFDRRDRGETDIGARRQASRIDARLDKALGELLIQKEMLALFVRVWLEHNPPIDESLEESAAASAEARFERFLALVANALAPGRSMLSQAWSDARPEEPEPVDAEPRP